MFIPTWLLVIAVVLLMLAFMRGEQVAGLFRSLGCLVIGVGFVASVGFGLYFLTQREYGLALACVSPVLAWSAWQAVKDSARVWSDRRALNEAALRRFLKRDHRFAARTTDPSLIAEARLQLAERIELGATLWQLYDQIKYFPSWYSLPQQGNWPGSKIVAAADIALLSSSDVARLGLDIPKADRENLQWWFDRREPAKFLLVLRDVDSVPDDSDDDGSSQFLSGLRVHEFVVAEHPKTILLRARVIYKAGVDRDAYHSATVEAFRPRDWVLDLFRATANIKSEQDAWGNEVVRQHSRVSPERARKDFMES